MFVGTDMNEYKLVREFQWGPLNTPIEAKENRVLPHTQSEG